MLMIGVDTNVLVRLLVADDERQFDEVRRLIRNEANGGDPVLISQLVLLECGDIPLANVEAN